MEREDLNFFKKWFSDYCRSFYSKDVEDQRNISLKELHTHNVCGNIAEIAERLHLSKERTLLAEAVALFHDIGRFRQYAEYKTFRDSVSVNHGLLGAKILTDKKILHRLPDNEQQIILKSVKFHNAFAMPKNENEEIIFFIKLIRDADKLDIWRVFLEYYESPAGERASAAGLGLPDTPEYSKEILRQFDERKIVPLSKIKTLNDFKLMQLSWIYDLNFSPSFQLLIEKNYIDRIIAHLPQTEEIKRISVSLAHFVHKFS